MALTEKYQSLLDIARQHNITDLSVQESENVLHVSGTAPSEDAKKKVWDEYSRIDPDMRAGDMVLNIVVAGGAAAGQAQETYTVKSGDSLSKIAKQYGVNWQDIFEANQDQIKDPGHDPSGTEASNSRKVASNLVSMKGGAGLRRLFSLRRGRLLSKGRGCG